MKIYLLFRYKMENSYPLFADIRIKVFFRLTICRKGVILKTLGLIARERKRL